MIRALLTKWADARFVRRVAELETELAAERRLHEVTSAERDAMAAVVARDRARIEAETAAYGKAKAEYEHAGKLS